MSIIFLYNFSKKIIIIFFFNDTATTEIYTLSLHDALPISKESRKEERVNELAKGNNKEERVDKLAEGNNKEKRVDKDRKSTRLNSSHLVISYAVFCLKKKIKILYETTELTA